MNVICMKWGDKFPVEYVNRLYGMVFQNLDSEFRFVCFTEKSKGIRPEVEIQELPELFKAVQKEVEILKDEGRILLRYSGTESKVRLLVEATSEKLVHSSFHNLKLAIQNSLSST